MEVLSNVELEGFLREYFPQLSDLTLREEIMRVASVNRFEPGEITLDYGSYVKMVPLVVSGRIKVMRADESGREILLYFLNPGETCTMSFSCCLAHKRSEVRTVAEEESTVIGIPVDQVDRWMTIYPMWKNFVMRAYDERMFELIKTIDSIAFKKMDERLLEYLKVKSSQSAKGIVIATHREIADDLFASREAVSRLLKQLEREGKIVMGRNEIRLIR